MACSGARISSQRALNPGRSAAFVVPLVAAAMKICSWHTVRYELPHLCLFVLLLR